MTREALTGPPPVVTATVSKTWNEPITVTISTSTRTGRSSGRVIRQKICALGGAVQGGRLVDVVRDRLQAGEDQQGGVAHVAPDVDEGDGRDGPSRAAEERDPVQADPLEELVDDADLVVEHPEPQQRTTTLAIRNGSRRTPRMSVDLVSRCISTARPRAIDGLEARC